MEDNRDKILQFIRMRGPVIPVEISKFLNSNILLASAQLSELTANRKLKVSHVKIGGTPLYYIPGQESQLQKFAENLNEKEKRAYELLMQKKILRDNEQEPLTRVALRAIKDYAVALQVDSKDGSEIFWRWFLLDNSQAEALIKPIFQGIAEPKKEAVQEIKKQEKEIQKKIEETPKKAEKPVEKPTEKTIERPKISKKEKTDNSGFLEHISTYMSRNKINILNKEIIKKGEIDFIIQIPSAVGNLEYYCKAKSKKSINDSDLASAFVQGQLRKLPVLFLTDGEPTKRAKEMIQKDFKGMNLVYI